MGCQEGAQGQEGVQGSGHVASGPSQELVEHQMPEATGNERRDMLSHSERYPLVSTVNSTAVAAILK